MSPLDVAVSACTVACLQVKYPLSPLDMCVLVVVVFCHGHGIHQGSHCKLQIYCKDVQASALSGADHLPHMRQCDKHVPCLWAVVSLESSRVRRRARASGATARRRAAWHARRRRARSLSWRRSPACTRCSCARPPPPRSPTTARSWCAWHGCQRLSWLGFITF